MTFRLDTVTIEELNENNEVINTINYTYNASINYNKDNQIALDSTDTLELQKYIDEGHFAKGSMLPKINACMNFLNENSEGIAIIASLNEGLEAINGDKGTRIFYRRK